MLYCVCITFCINILVFMLCLFNCLWLYLWFLPITNMFFLSLMDLEIHNIVIKFSQYLNWPCFNTCPPYQVQVQYVWLYQEAIVVQEEQTRNTKCNIMQTCGTCQLATVVSENILQGLYCLIWPNLNDVPFLLPQTSRYRRPPLPQPLPSARGR